MPTPGSVSDCWVFYRRCDPPPEPEELCNAGVKPLMVEWEEGRGLAKGNPPQQNRSRTPCRAKETGMANPTRARSGKPPTQPRGSTYTRPHDLPSALERIRQAARRDRKMRFTALLHHIYNPDMLREAYFRLKREAAPGVDGETWAAYGETLEDNLRDLSERLKRGAYRAKPVRRVYIPKADGRQRPLGVPVLEDKLVQRATVEVMNAIYEADFLGFSYGFRPGRGPHHALDALYAGLLTRKVNWVLDADIRGFFDAIVPGWLVKFVEHRVADRRVVRLIQQWLAAGVLGGGAGAWGETGAPHGGGGL